MVVIRVVRACFLLLLQLDYSSGVCVVVCCCVNHHGYVFCFFPLRFGPRRLVVCCDFFLPSLRPDRVASFFLEPDCSGIIA